MTLERGNAPAQHPPVRVRLAAVVATSCLAGLAWSARSFVVGPRFVFLWWNLFLAWVPWLVSAWYVRSPQRHWATTVLATSAWLIFFPNAPYLVTDLVHLKPRPPVPFWFDALLLSSFALAGCALGWTSLDLMRQRLEQARGRRWSMAAVALVVALTGFGVYLGRFLRWNSWDVVTQPLELASAVLASATEPHAVIFSAAFAGFVGAGYLLVAERT